MLLNKGFQPPRKYAIPVSDSRQVNSNQGCQVCGAKAWTKELYSKLANGIQGANVIEHMYRISADELRAVVLQGCAFCHSLADGIHGKIFLDDLYARFKDNELSTSDDEEGDGGGGNRDKTRYTSQDANGVDKQAEDDSDDWNDASAFNEEEIDEDVTGGWDAWEDRDTLAEFCKLDVTMAFVRGDGDLFEFLNVYIEAVDSVNSGGRLGTLKGDERVILRYHINEKVSYQAEPVMFPMDLTGTLLGSRGSMHLISQWASKLEQKDADIVFPSDQVPARLIRINNHGLLQVVETSTIAHHERRFAALSYVWGTNQTFILTTKTMSNLMSKFQVSDLPQTIQDAISVTIQAGLSLIWVDALCIVQDSPADKAIELPKMRHIYKNAVLTIVASIAQSAVSGFLHHAIQQDYFIDPIPISLTRTSSGDALALTLSYPSSYHRTSDPINSRAWTFQELILSTRAISFSYRGVTFLDRTNPPAPDGNVSGRDMQLPNLPWNGGLFSLTQSQENIRSTWLALRSEYSRRSLTVQADKLLAIAGLAEEVGRSYNGEYLAGLWKSDLSIDLQWRCLRSDNRQKKKRSATYVAPSWTWASVDAVVDGAEFDAEDQGNESMISNAMGFEVVSCSVELIDPGFPFGAVKSGKLVVVGKAHLLLWRPFTTFDVNTADADGEVVAIGREGADLPIGEACIDALDDELHDGTEVMCLTMGLQGREKDCGGLVLLRVDDRLGAERIEPWRRVGYFTTKWRELFNDTELAQFTII